MYNKSLWLPVCTAGIVLAGCRKQGGTAEFTSLPFIRQGLFFFFALGNILDKRIRQEIFILLGNEVNYERQIKENHGQCH